MRNGAPLGDAPRLLLVSFVRSCRFFGVAVRPSRCRLLGTLDRFQGIRDCKNFWLAVFHGVTSFLYVFAYYSASAS